MEVSEVKGISVVNRPVPTTKVVKQNETSRQQISRMLEDVLLTPQELEQRKIIHQGQKDKATLNVYRELRTKLLAKSAGKNFVCMVSAVCSGGGASHVARNVAASIALDPAKTALLIDCNLYSPSVDELLTIKPDFGLTNFLDEEDGDVQDIIYASGVPRLRVIPAGSQFESAAEHFSSERMLAFVNAVKNRYPDRYIIIDAPAMTGAAETRILSSVCDLALLVVPYGKVTESQIRAGINTLGQGKLAGLVFNHAGL